MLFSRYKEDSSNSIFYYFGSPKTNFAIIYKFFKLIVKDTAKSILW